MGVRRERVILELQDDFSPRALRAAAATALLKREVDSLSRNAVTSGRSQRDMADGIDRTSTAAARGEKAIDRYSGRLAIWADIAAILGPGMVPIATVGVPALSSMASQLGFTMVAAGGLMAAVKGLGDVVKAANDYAVEPSAENLAKYRAVMEQASPATRDLVRELMQLRAVGKQIQDTGREALFPGVLDAINELETRVPDLLRIVDSVNTELGNLARDGASALAGAQWDDFFRFLATDAPPALEAMGRILGRVAHAAAEMWMAFDPVNDDVLVWLADGAARLDEWATALSQTEGFHDFLAYLRETGPEVGDAFAAIAKAVVAIAEAAAPLGGHVLNALTALAEAAAKVAGSDMGTPIMATVTALALLRRGTQAWASISGTAWATNIRGAETYAGRLAAARGPLLKSAGLMAGMAVASSGAADGMNLTNTASMALMGTIAGPWGAAIGGAIGLIMDLGGSNKQTAIDAQGLTDTLNQQTGAITKATEAFMADELQKRGAYDAAERLGVSLSDVTSAALGNELAMQRVNSAIELTKSGYFNYAGQLISSAEDARRFGQDQNTLTSALGKTNGALTESQGRVRQMADAAVDGFGRAESAAESFSRAVARINRILSERASWRDYEAALDDFTKAVKENGRSLDITTKKGRDNQAALDDIAGTAIKVAQNLNGLDRQEFLTRARRDFVDAAQKAGMTEAAARRLGNKLLEVGRINAKPKVDAQSNVDFVVGHVKSQLASLRDRTVNITTIYTTRHVNKESQAGSYDTGGFTGWGPKYEPRGVVHAGEVVIPQELVRRDWSLLSNRYGHLPGFADGGVVGGGDKKLTDAEKKHRELMAKLAKQRQEYRQDVRDALASFMHADPADVRELTKSLKELREAVGKKWTPAMTAQADQVKAASAHLAAALTRKEAADAELARVTEAKNSFASSVSGLYTTDFSEGQSLAAWMREARTDVAHRDTQNRALATLTSMGLDPTSDMYRKLAAGENWRLAAQAASSQGAFESFRTLYQQQQAMNTTAGRDAAQISYGAELKAATDMATRTAQHAEEMRDELRNIRNELQAFANSTAGLPSKFSQGVGDVLNQDREKRRRTFVAGNRG